MTTALGTILGSERKAKALLSKFPLRNILFLTRHELHEAGLPYKTAARLESAVQLVTEAMADAPRKQSPLVSSQLAYDYIMSKLGSTPGREESFWILCLDLKQQPLCFEQISLGGIGETTVSIRRIVRTVYAANASRVILTHNHPSQDPLPSSADRALTSHIRDTLKPLDIDVIDHLIIANNDYYSFADNDQI